MQIKKEYVLREVAGTWVVLSLAADTINFSGMLTLNESGAMLWKLLEQNCEKEALVDALLAEYEDSREEAEQDVEAFLEKLMRAACIERG